jgi:carbon-monoxide dehydrogenase medium subunit
VKAARFEYECPSDVAAAITLAERGDGAVRFIAGGQSLGPMLNLRLAQPDMLVDLTGIAELKQIKETADSLSIGSCVTHADIEDGRVPDVTRGLLRSVARAELPIARVAQPRHDRRQRRPCGIRRPIGSRAWRCLGASVLVRGPSGGRAVPIEDFVLGVFETALRPGELVEGVTVPRLSRRRAVGFL